MADPIKASIEVEIDPTPEEVLVRVERMDGDVLLVDADGYEIAVLTEETFNRAMVTPPVPCPECGEVGACAVDAEGRALIHVTEEDPDADT